jgi:hypothetical protein
MFTGLGPSAPTRAGGPIAFPPPGTVPPNPNVADANPNTFYSAMTNIDFEIGDGNPAAVAVRFHLAQHAFLTHMDFHIGSGMAALYQVGNEAEDLHFYGGRYAILTENTSPAWQFTLIDSSFEGQRESAIRGHEAGLTLIRDTFRNVPTAIDLDPPVIPTRASRTLPVLRSLSVWNRVPSPKSDSRMRSSTMRRLSQNCAKAAKPFPERALSTRSKTSIMASLFPAKAGWGQSACGMKLLRSLPCPRHFHLPSAPCRPAANGSTYTRSV